MPSCDNSFPATEWRGYNRRNESEGIKDSQVILGSTLFRVTRRGPTGSSVTAPRDSVNVIRIGQFLGEPIENMCSHPESCQQDEWTPFPAPVEYLQPNTATNPGLHGVEARLLPDCRPPEQRRLSSQPRRCPPFASPAVCHGSGLGRAIGRAAAGMFWIHYRYVGGRDLRAIFSIYKHLHPFAKTSTCRKTINSLSFIDNY